jgi:hypothetical protein
VSLRSHRWIFSGAERAAAGGLLRARRKVIPSAVSSRTVLRHPFC